MMVEWLVYWINVRGIGFEIRLGQKIFNINIFKH